MRAFERIAPSQLLNVIAPNNCDVFLSTWDVVEYGKGGRPVDAPARAPLNIQHVRETYGIFLKDLQVLPFEKTQRELPAVFQPSMVSMFFQIQQADELRRKWEQTHGWRYDLVIRCRPDLIFHTGFKVDDVSFFSSALWTTAVLPHHIQDLFAISTPDVMNIYASLFNYLPEYRNVDFEALPGAEEGRRPERILKYHLEKHGIPLRVMPVQTELFRGTVFEQPARTQAVD